MSKQTITLNTNFKMPLVGFGTWKLTGEDAYSAVKSAIEAGYRHIDTAMIYRNEVEVGRAIKDSGVDREDLFITTKLWNDDHEDVQGAFDTSLDKLNLDYVDLYLMHWPLSTRNTAYAEMEKLVKSGRVKSIGVSNFTIKHLEELLETCKTVPAVNQVEFSPYLNQVSLKEFCTSKGIALEAYSPLSQGNKLSDPKLETIANKYHKSPAQILLKWAVQQDIVVIPKSSNAGRIAQNIDIFDFDLEENDFEEISSWNENARFCGDPTDMP